MRIIGYYILKLGLFFTLHKTITISILIYFALKKNI